MTNKHVDLHKRNAITHHTYPITSYTNSQTITALHCVALRYTASYTRFTATQQ